ncbi:30S ribosome-binding factor RbfA [uncultured Nevskia sp.]|uniref:30S ribosome-binding factor RbfA n=1 Tax=uncultured Nevskia sp. TaxID=228950 RepID=UPI0025CE4B9E|nr:30S ribosome-binding factor RbfA [uncultured Nevskia sp.]
MRINSQLQRELSELIRDELTDPRIGKLTVTDVVVAADVRNAKISISQLGTDDELKQAVKALNGAAGRLRHLLVDRMRIRHVPTLHFTADMALREADRVGGLIREAIANDQASSEAADSKADLKVADDEPPAS